MRKVISFILLLLPLAANAIDTSYHSLNDISMSSQNTAKLSVSHKSSIYYIEFSFYSQRNTLSPLYVQNHFISSSNLLFNFLDENKFTAHCNLNDRLEVYDIDWKILNDSSRFSWQSDARYIRGLYDPRHNEFRVSSIILTDKGASETLEVIAHETAHYWYDRLCLYKGQDLSTEKFAVQFEEYYKKEKI